MHVNSFTNDEFERVRDFQAMAIVFVVQHWDICRHLPNSRETQHCIAVNDR